MKKIYVLVLVIGMIAGTSHAQGTYLRLGVGGGIGLKQYGVFLTQNLYYGFYWADETVTSSSDNIEVKSMGLGGGFNANLAFGYMFSDHVGIEFGVNEFFGMVKKMHYSSSSDYGEYSYDRKISGKMLQIVPAIVITPGLEKVNPYARLGMIIGVLPVVTAKLDGTSTYSGGTLKETSTYSDKQKIYGGLALGFTAAAGASIDLGEKIAFFGEIVFNGLSYAPSKGKFRTWTEDGVDQLATATTKEKEWTYEKKYDTDEDIPDGTPDKLPKMTLTFSNVELNLGIKFKF